MEVFTSPIIVKVFPEPVCPYAKQLTLVPAKTDATRGCTRLSYMTLFETVSFS